MLQLRRYVTPFPRKEPACSPRTHLPTHNAIGHISPITSRPRCSSTGWASATTRRTSSASASTMGPCLMPLARRPQPIRGARNATSAMPKAARSAGGASPRWRTRPVTWPAGGTRSPTCGCMGPPGAGRPSTSSRSTRISSGFPPIPSRSRSGVSTRCARTAISMSAGTTTRCPIALCRNAGARPSHGAGAHRLR